MGSQIGERIYKLREELEKLHNDIHDLRDMDDNYVSFMTTTTSFLSMLEEARMDAHSICEEIEAKCDECDTKELLTIKDHGPSFDLGRYTWECAKCDI